MKHIKLFEQFMTEGMSQEDLDKVTSMFETHKRELKDALYKGSDHMYWNVEVLPAYDNVIGGYNLQAFATDVVDRNTTLDKFQVKRAIDAVKKLPFVSKARISPAYNKKYLTVIAIGLKIK